MISSRSRLADWLIGIYLLTHVPSDHFQLQVSRVYAYTRNKTFVASRLSLPLSLSLFHGLLFDCLSLSPGTCSGAQQGASRIGPTTSSQTKIAVRPSRNHQRQRATRSRHLTGQCWSRRLSVRQKAGKRKPTRESEIEVCRDRKEASGGRDTGTSKGGTAIAVKRRSEEERRAGLIVSCPS